MPSFSFHTWSWKHKGFDLINRFRYGFSHSRLVNTKEYRETQQLTQGKLHMTILKTRADHESLRLPIQADVLHLYYLFDNFFLLLYNTKSTMHVTAITATTAILR